MLTRVCLTEFVSYYAPLPHSVLSITGLLSFLLGNLLTVVRALFFIWEGAFTRCRLEQFSVSLPHWLSVLFQNSAENTSLSPIPVFLPFLLFDLEVALFMWTVWSILEYCLCDRCYSQWSIVLRCLHVCSCSRWSPCPLDSLWAGLATVYITGALLK